MGTKTARGLLVAKWAFRATGVGYLAEKGAVKGWHATKAVGSGVKNAASSTWNTSKKAVGAEGGKKAWQAWLKGFGNITMTRPLGKLCKAIAKKTARGAVNVAKRAVSKEAAQEALEQFQDQALTGTAMDLFMMIAHAVFALNVKVRNKAPNVARAMIKAWKEAGNEADMEKAAEVGLAEDAEPIPDGVSPEEYAMAIAQDDLGISDEQVLGAVAAETPELTDQELYEIAYMDMEDPYEINELGVYDGLPQERRNDYEDLALKTEGYANNVIESAYDAVPASPIVGAYKAAYDTVSNKGQIVYADAAPEDAASSAYDTVAPPPAEPAYADKATVDAAAEHGGHSSGMYDAVPALPNGQDVDPATPSSTTAKALDAKGNKGMDKSREVKEKNDNEKQLGKQQDLSPSNTGPQPSA